MSKTAVDTSVIVAALLSWHEHHDIAAAALEKLLARRSVILPLPALVESYSVMTRLPAPYRVRPGDAYDALHDSFREVPVAAFTSADPWPFFGRLVAGGFAGGVIYDAVIVETAVDAGADSLLTFNRRDYDRLRVGMISIVVPGA